MCIRDRDAAIEAAEQLLGDLTADGNEVFEDIIPEDLSIPLELPGDNSDEAADYDAQAE